MLTWSLNPADSSICCDTNETDVEPSWTRFEISFATALCSSTAAAIVLEASVTLCIPSLISEIPVTASPVDS